MDAYKLRATVTHVQGSYPALMADTIGRYQRGEPVLYYTWTPYWVSGVLVPGKDVVWLQVPFSSNPEKANTRLDDGSDYGFSVNVTRIVVNRDWAEKNPAAVKLFEVMRLPIADIVNARVIALDDAPQGYETFDQGAATKFVLDTHDMLAAA